MCKSYPCMSTAVYIWGEQMVEHVLDFGRKRQQHLQASRRNLPIGNSLTGFASNLQEAQGRTVVTLGSRVMGMMRDSKSNAMYEHTSCNLATMSSAKPGWPCATATATSAYGKQEGGFREICTADNSTGFGTQASPFRGCLECHSLMSMLTGCIRAATRACLTQSMATAFCLEFPEVGSVTQQQKLRCSSGITQTAIRYQLCIPLGTIQSLLGQQSAAGQASIGHQSVSIQLSTTISQAAASYQSGSIQSLVGHHIVTSWASVWP